VCRLPGKWVWFELVTPDVRRSQAFHAEVLGWKVQPFPIGEQTYEVIFAADAMIGAYAAQRAQRQSRWISAVSVADVERAVAEAVVLGGRPIEPISEVPGAGRRARLLDCQGVEFTVSRNAMGDPPDTQSVPEGRWLWNELHVPDAGRALDFYGRVIGYQHRSFGPGGGAPYVIFSRDGVDRAGVTSAGCPDVAPHWLPYVHVKDVDAAAARARAAGGQVRKVEDIPGVGRIAAILEPAGAMLALLSPRPGLTAR